MTADAPIVITATPLDRAVLDRLVRAQFGDMVKFVVDVRREVAAVGGELHADGEALLLDSGAAQEDLWGANYYPSRGADRCLEYTALINIRPAQGNPGMEIADPDIRRRVRELAFRLIGRGDAL